MLTPRIDSIDKNLVINGSLDFWQRGTSFSITAPAASRYTADRMFSYVSMSGMNSTISRQPGQNSRFCIRSQRDLGISPVGNLILSQTVETLFARDLAGETITLQFRARKGADYSAAMDVLKVRLSYGSGVMDTNLTTAGFTSPVTVEEDKILTSSFQTFSVSLALPVSATQLGFELIHQTLGTAGANDYFEVEQIQITKGEEKSRFSRAGGQYDSELALCERYFEKSYDLEQALGAIVNRGAVFGHASNTDATLGGRVGMWIQFKNTKRAIVTTTSYNPQSGVPNEYYNLTLNVTVLGNPFDQESTKSMRMNPAGVAQGTAVYAHYSIDAEIN